jgi:hypothetical protein
MVMDEILVILSSTLAILAVLVVLVVVVVLTVFTLLLLKYVNQLSNTFLLSAFLPR